MLANCLIFCQQKIEVDALSQQIRKASFPFNLSKIKNIFFDITVKNPIKWVSYFLILVITGIYFDYN